MKKQIVIYLVVVFCFCFGGLGVAQAGDVQAGRFLNEYDKHTADGNQTLIKFLETHIDGVGTGIEWGATMWNIKTICQPRTLSVTTSQKISMLRQYVKKSPVSKEFDVGMILIKAYEYTFPCNQ